jgi:hypothetical protein
MALGVKHQHHAEAILLAILQILLVRRGDEGAAGRNEAALYCGLLRHGAVHDLD